MMYLLKVKFTFRNSHSAPGYRRWLELFPILFKNRLLKLCKLSSCNTTKVKVRVNNGVTVAEEAVSAQLWMQANENSHLAALQVPSN